MTERTQGWAASLQLVSASIAVSRPSEVGAFIEALSGATGPIYDFLAEEVLTRMSPMTQRILVHASILDLVTPSLVAAALSATSEATDLETVATHLRDAQSLGLLGDSADASTGARMHPLFRQFLEHQLEQTTPPDRIRAMHLAVAQALRVHLVAGGRQALRAGRAARRRDESPRLGRQRSARHRRLGSRRRSRRPDA